MSFANSKPIGYLQIHEEGKPTRKFSWQSPKYREAYEYLVCQAFIYLGKEILVGRGNGYTDLCFDDQTVSCHHLKIYSIIYDQDDLRDVKPLIYAEDLSSNGTYWNEALIGRGNSAVLLNHGDRLRISPRITLKFHALLDYETDGADDSQILEMKHFAETYHVTKRKLGAGGHGIIYMAIARSTGRQVACKIIDLRAVRRNGNQKLSLLKKGPDQKREEQSVFVTPARVSERSLRQSTNEYTNRIRREVDIMKGLCHPNIIRLEKVYESSNTLYIFEELVTGGDLYSYVQYKGGHLEEAQSAVLIHQIIQGIEYLHRKEIVHRDLKPENILIATLADAARIVITDFGSAFKSIPGARKPARMETELGTLEYVAPEVKGRNTHVKEKGYTKAVDMWSLGCTSIYLFTGTSLFLKPIGIDDRRDTAEATLEAAAGCDLSRMETDSEWETISDCQKDFVRKLLVLDEDERMTAQEALNHPWFAQCKEALNAVYEHATRYWKPFRQLGTLIEKIRMDSDHDRNTKRRSRKKSKSGLQKPIEPHYQPFHKRVEHLVSPVRPRTSLSTIVEDAEEWRFSTSHIKKSTPTESTFLRQISGRTDQDMQNDLPAVETLSISDIASSIDVRSRQRSRVKLPKPITPRRQRRPTPGRKQARIYSNNSEGSFSDLSIEPQSKAASPNINEGSWTLQRGTPDHSGLSDEVAMDLDDVPITSRESLFQRPLRSISQMQSLTPKRKHRQIFEVDGNIEAFVAETPGRSSSDYSFSTRTVPITKRQFVKPNQLQTRIRPGPRLLDQIRADRTVGHDGPLLSKADFGNSSPKRTKSKFVSFGSLKGKSTTEANPSTCEEVDLETISTGILTQTLSKRPRIVFDRTACSSSLGVGKENRDVHNIPNYQEDFNTIQGLGQKEKPVLSDLSDSIRTAYG